MFFALIMLGIIIWLLWRINSELRELNDQQRSLKMSLTRLENRVDQAQEE